MPLKGLDTSSAVGLSSDGEDLTPTPEETPNGSNVASNSRRKRPIEELSPPPLKIKR